MLNAINKKRFELRKECHPIRVNLCYNQSMHGDCVLKATDQGTQKTKSGPVQAEIWVKEHFEIGSSQSQIQTLFSEFL